MRLLHTKTLKLEGFGDQNIPLYAILSHTWGKEEISLQDLETGNLESRRGFSKLKSTCCRAAADGFDYVWIDTCCIDKRSSAELSEAINSMYRWYQNATVCYAYLEDVYSNPGENSEDMDHESRESRWFTRGWTLQELIAPSILIFFNKTWEQLGTKTSMAASISSFTRIPQSILLGGDLDQESVARRMSWASTRQTTRVEDLAYCLLGIFNINMPLLYGEGERAFVRLQEEIIKVSTDYSLFAWRSRSRGLLAPDPSAFRDSADIVPIPALTNPGDAAIVDSEGVHVTLRVQLENEDSDTYSAIFPCTNGDCNVGIRIRGQVGGFFRREDCKLLLFDYLPAPVLSDYVEKRICVQQPRVRRHEGCPLQKAVEAGNTAIVNLLLKNGFGIDPIWVHTRTGKKRLSSAAFLDLYNTGASTQYQSGQMLVPLSLAIQKGHHEIVKMLLDRLDHLHGHKEYNFPDLYSSLMFALRKGHCGVLKVVTEHGGHMAREALCQPEAFEKAIRSGRGDVVELLLTYTWDLNQTTYKIPMLDDLLCISLGEKSFHDILKVLLKYCPDLPQQRIFNGCEPLDWAVQSGYEDAVRLLLRHGAGSENAVLSPESISLAAGRGYESVLRLLVAESDQFKDLIVKSNVVVKASFGRKEVSDWSIPNPLS
ncbi:hypothetical protein LTR47_007594 [Exophiala xenobiotica]|nr:hypothetical protein LTR92_001069 [Exophiala xenobiotica]KAK5230452.1 hypothetical protein LTR47_007594 [Exophiala xenobiotica]KAK5259851.1 hypothetical protein LTR40_005212 [Exophiala xenobiotica]KAK5346081.1 hypothetical protein LTR61_010118 [Exophiala xenobiotica]KAK5359705.1 hypothetical protein LTR11_010434 [Exophiala xenobiotica]